MITDKRYRRLVRFAHRQLKAGHTARIAELMTSTRAIREVPGSWSNRAEHAADLAIQAIIDALIERGRNINELEQL